MLAWYVGALTVVAAEFLLLSASTIKGGGVVACVLCPVHPPVSFESAATASTDAGISSVKAAATVKTIPSLKPYQKALLFCYSFRSCQTLPVTAVMFYSPVLLERVNGNLNPLLQVALIYTGFPAGTLPMPRFGDRLPARWVPVGTFAAMATGLGGIAWIPLPLYS